MERSLFLLVLMGHSFVISVHFYEYHFVNENKTWHEAQKYCREKHTDLATAYDMTDMKRLKDSVKNRKEAWIGLYSDTVEMTLRWSLPGVEYKGEEIKEMWSSNEPDPHNEHHCVRIRQQKWADVKCTKEYYFICYNGKNQQNEKIHVINQNKTWLDAQSYCREHHTDLISGVDQINDLKMQSPELNVNFWIGLFRDKWGWSDNSTSSFRNWGNADLFVVKMKQCAVVTSSGKWSSDDCGKKKPFICYKDKMILIKQKKTWESALKYCRQNHRDLVTITNDHQQKMVQELAKKAKTDFIWLGMRYTCALGLWFWVSDELVCYKKWDPENEEDKCHHAAAMKIDGSNWFKKADTDLFDFVCTL